MFQHLWIYVSIGLLSGLHVPITGQAIQATGGGVIKEGEDLELKRPTVEKWKECTWRFYKDPNKPSTCTFNATSGEVVDPVCSSSDAAALMEYTGKSANECSITVKGVSNQINGKWTVEIDTSGNQTEIQIVVANPVESGEIVVGNQGIVRAGETSNVTCILHGGRPAPAVYLQVVGLEKSHVVSSSQTQIANETGHFESRFWVEIRPTPEDFNKTVECKSNQMDQMNKSLFQFKANSAVLNVMFGPQPMSEQKYKVIENMDIVVSFEFMANPKPTLVKWNVSQPAKDPGNEPAMREEVNDNTTSTEVPKADAEGQSVTFTPGHSDDKYVVSDIIDEGNAKYRANFTIKNVQLSEATNKYHLDVENSEGMTQYGFNLVVEPKGPGGGSNDATDESGASVWLIVVILALITLFVGGAIVIYKKKMRNNETQPLNTGRRP
ncbi:hypothetical protein TCAL_04886 [Tigriopus californicus]|uniref:Ig-like domain-containing protein n=1 Tax=Tigriopus californicus TaxID=6832 RepID=A0A553NX02_TIGCA|nr:hypothetical protein TCAL_04886 [Tigriopus californicus]|eukprot:TCALIF_04886-PA protein Name:"Protein of unknown function" AED:0.21 eAED:0.34 QI:0/-1/0/1/-1/1/1/0/437